MRIPYSWLEQLLPDLQAGLLERFMQGTKQDTTTIAFNPISEISQTLNSLGLEVDVVDVQPGAPAGTFVAEVTDVSPIKDSDHLLRTKVSTGDKTYTVVTGAPNTRKGMLTALALPGTHLPAVDLLVESREMVGVPSQGVLCSPKELGVYDYAAGLIEFGRDVTPGQALEDVWPLETVLELELTPNRADAFSVLGIARDLAAKLNLELHHPAQDSPRLDSQQSNGLTVKVEDTDGCPRFTLALIKGVEIAPSPLWLQRRLAALGLRPRNNVVDITNYVTFELGQPSHAYDRDDLEDDTIVVRRAHEGETLRTLGDEDVTLSEHDLLITMPGITPEGADTRPIGVAGVIGGLHHSVKASTQNVALEVAHFEPVTIRKTAKRLGLSTDAHYRFERGVDPNLPPIAAARAAQLIAELAGGTVHAGLVDTGADMPARTVPFRPERVAFLMAIDVPETEQQAALEALGCTVDSSQHPWQVHVPSWRFDLAIEEDLIEEVSRLHGYDAIPETIPHMHFVPPQADITHRHLRSTLAAMGMQETITYAFTGPDELKAAAAPEAIIKLTHPQGVERSVLRTALYPGLLTAARNNQRESGLAMFEIGRVFNHQESERLSILLSGDWVGASWQAASKVDFFVFKGLLETLGHFLGSHLLLEPASADSAPHLHPGVSARVYWLGSDGDYHDVGYLGQVHPRIAAAFELPDTFVAELTLPLKRATQRFEDINRQPYAERDLAVVVPETLAYASLQKQVQQAAGEKLESLVPFDVYQGDRIPEGSKSVALRLRFRDAERALRDEEVDGFMANIITSVRQAGYDIRS
jgi:phenylalanyl-tRNA synthetase beta chain